MTNPHEGHSEDGEPAAEAAVGLSGLFRKVLSSGPSAEERLEELLAARRRELEAHAARFDASIADLERREELLRDSRAAVERMLRLRTAELEARESELTDFLRELTEREGRLAEAEVDLARRRAELGAVELRRAAVESREQAVIAREEHLAELEARQEARSAAQGRAQLALVPGPEYRLIEIEDTNLTPGASIDVDGEEYVVARIGPSPLPTDSRRCAYLVRGTRGVPSSGSL